MVLPLLPIAVATLAGGAVGGISATLGGYFSGGGGSSGDTLSGSAVKKGSEVNIDHKQETTTDNRVYHAPYEHYSPSYNYSPNYTTTYSPYTVLVYDSPNAQITASKKDSLTASPTTEQAPTVSASENYTPTVTPTSTLSASAESADQRGGGSSDTMKGILLIGGVILLLGGGAYYVLKK